VSLAQARDRHFAARKILASGIDPMAKRKAEAEAKQREVEAQEREAENSFERVARKWWDWWVTGKSNPILITSCGVWKQTFFRRSATNPSTL
jgi:hypothetical protein